MAAPPNVSYAFGTTPATGSYSALIQGLTTLILGVNTTVSAAISSGSQTVTPASTTNIAVGSALWVNWGMSDQECVTVTATGTGTFTATFATSHSAGAAIQCGLPTLGVTSPWLSKTVPSPFSTYGISKIFVSNKNSIFGMSSYVPILIGSSSPSSSPVTSMSFATADDIDISGNPYAVNGANMTLSSSAYSGVPFSTNNFPIQDTTFNWWACCTEYSVAVFALISGTYQAMYVGALKNPASLNTSGVSTATGTLASSGSNVTIPLAVDITSNLQVGQQIGILNQSHSYSSSHFGAFERQAIVSLSGGASPTVTVTSLTNSYDTGALVGNIPQNMTCSAQTGSVSGTMYMTRNNNFTYSSGTAQTGTFDTGILSSINSYNSPTGSASLNGGKWAGEVDGAIYQTTSAYQGISGFLIGLQYFGYGGVSALDYFSDLPLVWKIFLSASTCSCGIGPLVNAQNTLTSVGWVP